MPQLSPEEELVELERVLRRHRFLLDRDLNDDRFESENLHHPVAGQLRSLLCDSDIPILLAYAERRGIDLKIWGPYPSGHCFDDDEILFAWSHLVASWDRPYLMGRPDGHELSIDEYLDTPLGVQYGSYTPRQLIKWVANKEGTAHLDFRKPAGLQALKRSARITQGGEIDEAEIRRALREIGDWTIRAADHVLPELDR